MAAREGELSEADRVRLRRCVELAGEALAAGSDPYGALLTDADDRVLIEQRNESNPEDATRHPELAIVHWAIANLTPAERRRTTVYTSGEPCPMCSAAHAWAGLGRIVYAVGVEQRTAWYREWELPPAPVAPHPVNAIAPSVPVAGPDPALAGAVRDLHAERLGIT